MGVSGAGCNKNFYTATKNKGKKGDEKMVLEAIISATGGAIGTTLTAWTNVATVFVQSGVDVLDTVLKAIVCQ